MYKSTMIIQYVINNLPYFYAGITPPLVPQENVKSLYLELGFKKKRTTSPTDT